MPKTTHLNLRQGDFPAPVATAGHGPPLLYLHGAIGQKGWAPFLDRLARRFTVHAPWLPGYGDSAGLEHLTDLTDLTLYHLELLDALRLGPAPVIGHFLGGMIAAEMAAYSPPSVSRLVLAAPAGLWRDDAPVADLLALSPAELLDRLAATPAAAHALNGPHNALTADRMPDLAAAGKFLWPLPDKGLARRAYRIKAPTLILWGQQDQINPPSYANHFQRLIADSRIETLPNAGHLLMLEQPDAFANAITSFLNQEA